MTNYVSVGKTPHLFYRAVDVRKKNDAVEPFLWLWDTSIQGPQNLVPEKCSLTPCIFCLALLKGLLFSGKEHFFGGTESILGLTSLQETPIKALKQ